MSLPVLTRSVSRRSSLVSAVAFPLGVWVVWRLAQAAVLLLSGGDLFDDTFRWDSNWYLNLLGRGYVVVDPTYATQSNAAFFPGLVWLTTPFTWVFADRTAAIIVVNLTSATAFIAVHGAIRAVIDQRTARRAVIGLAVWPMSLFLTAYYSEALFITATAAAVWAARRDKPAAAFAAAFIAGLTRSIGFALGPILAVDRWNRVRRVDREVIAYAASGPLGLALVASEQHRQIGDALGFAHAQQAWNVELAPPWEGVRRTFRTFGANGLDYFHWGVALDSLAIGLVALAMVVVTVRFWRRRTGLAMVGWGWAAALAPLCTTIFLSYGRYAMAVWPAWAVLGVGDSNRARAARALGALAAAAWSVVMIRYWTDGRWVA